MTGLLEILKSELMVLIMAATPLIELRGSLPYGIFVLDMNYIHAYIISVLGSIAPCPFILKFLPNILKGLKGIGIFAGFVDWVTNRANRKSEKVKRYSLWGLFILVAIPLPGTGVWTGSTIAALLKLPFKSAFIVCLLGTMVAGLLMLILSHFGLMIL
ncbi:MAG TPA: small multi-drug export protein [Eubacteriaceae bacterium]|jgi:uncharacterized membrane protein|nr:small multi-drug export protein [Eubacteriaceae bacterium]